MNNFSVGAPQTVFDWAAVRDEFRTKIEQLELEPISMLYGLSKTVGYRDDDFVQMVEGYLSNSPDPIRSRFYIAYHLCNRFYDNYDAWWFDVKQPSEPGFVGEMVDGFRDLVVEWILEGLKQYSDEPEIMDYAYFIVSRIGFSDTFLEQNDIPLMQAASKREISVENSRGAQELFEIVRKAFREHSGNDDGFNNDRADDPEADS
ncbi:MAG TPA: hypothetical protein VK851_14755 [Anaerolineales bacterium]|nr:hypothetical protein [Anaerolineales bacterium]